MSSRSPSQQAAQKVLDRELVVAESRGAERVRAQVRDVLRDARRIVRVGEHQIEVIEVAALAEVLAEEPE